MTYGEDGRKTAHSLIAKSGAMRIVTKKNERQAWRRRRAGEKKAAIIAYQTNAALGAANRG